jgi:NADPH:quinone reductase-like Zn-dependent oxidoreductase
MPKIVRFDRVGGTEVLQFKDEPSKQPGKGEVR